MTLSTLIRSLAAAFMLLLAAVAIPEPDVVKTTDGRELEGTITREVNGYVWLDMGVGEPLLIRPGEIKEIVRGSEREVTSDPVVTKGDKQTWERKPGVTRAAVITAEGTVGVQMSAKPLREAIPLLKEEGVDLVIFKVNSGGGLLIEIQRLSDVLHEEYKQNFQTVAWIESAISAAAMTSITLEEIYFQPRANFGAATGWFGALQAVTGRGLEDVLYKMEKIASRGGHDPLLMRAMQINETVSYDYDETTGQYTFHRNLDGDHILNDGTDILTLNAETAAAIGFSKGTAGTLEELTALLQQSVGEIEWVGERVPGETFPICKAEKHQREWRKEVTFQENRFGEVFTKYELEIQNAQSVPLESRGGFIRAAEGYLSRIKRMVEINPNFGLLRNITDEWFLQQEDRLRQLKR